MVNRGTRAASCSAPVTRSEAAWGIAYAERLCDRLKARLGLHREAWCAIVGRSMAAARGGEPLHLGPLCPMAQLLLQREWTIDTPPRSDGIRRDSRDGN